MENNQQTERIMRYADMIRRHVGTAVRPYRADGYTNMMTRYGTSKDTSEHYRFVPERNVSDELLTMFYEGNGLFAKIIDTPAEEALKRGFKLNGISDQNIEDFYSEALDELDWEETAMTAIKWTRLYGGSIAVLLVNDGRGLEEPLDWKNIRSIDDIRVYDRSVIQPDTASMFSYDPLDPFRTRGSRLGMPEFYQVYSRFGNFIVHDSRCLVFQNGILPEGATDANYQLWGVPEYIRISRAIRDAEIAHGSAPKLLDRSVQPVYKMKDLQQLLATEEGEDQVLRRMQIIDMARGLLNSLVIDKDGEEYDFKTFQFAGVSNVISASCNMLSAITNIPQTILFGQAVGGLSTTDDTSMENYYNYVQRIQRRMLKSNLRYLLSIIFQAGLSTGEVDEVPKIKVEFNPLWSLSDVEQADLDQKKANTQNLKARTAQIYVDMQALDSSEVRKSLASSDEFDVEEVLDEDAGDNLFPPDLTPGTPDDEEEEGNSPDAAPAATKLPEDMSEEEAAQSLDKTKADSRLDGGAGSGNFGHEGREGEVGGSAAGTGGVSLEKCPAGALATDNDGEAWKKTKSGNFANLQTGEVVSAGELGEFGGSVVEYTGKTDFPQGSVAQGTMNRRLWEINEREIAEKGYAETTSKDLEEMVGAVSHYGLGGDCQMMLATQDPDAYPEIVRTMSDADRKSYGAEMEQVERFIAVSPKADYPVYRGVSFNDEMQPENAQRVLSQLKVGQEISMGHVASWSSNAGTAESYAMGAVDAEFGVGQDYAVVYRVAHPHSAVNLSGINPEGEHLTPGSARFRVSRVNHTYDDDMECHRYTVDLEEM